MSAGLSGESGQLRAAIARCNPALHLALPGPDSTKMLAFVAKQGSSWRLRPPAQAEIVPGGNAERSGEVSVGDQLIATSGFTYTTQQKYQVGRRPCFGGFKA